MDGIEVASARIEADLLREDNERLRRLLSDPGSEGDWILRVTHVGPTPEKTVHSMARISVVTAESVEAGVFWDILDAEVEGMVRSIDRFEGKEERPRRRRPPDINSLMQDDMAVLMEVIGISTHARPISPHEVMINEIIPRVRVLVLRWMATEVSS